MNAFGGEMMRFGSNDVCVGNDLQNGHVGFMLSCYDAELCYDQKTNTFQAR